jgi:hypothetical protein
MSEPDPTIMAPSDPRDQLRGVERRLHDAAGRLLEGDDDQHQRFARLIRERGSTVSGWARR